LVKGWNVPSKAEILVKIQTLSSFSVWWYFVKKIFISWKYLSRHILHITSVIDFNPFWRIQKLLQNGPKGAINISNFYILMSTPIFPPQNGSKKSIQKRNKNCMPKITQKIWMGQSLFPTEPKSYFRHNFCRQIYFGCIIYFSGLTLFYAQFLQTFFAKKYFSHILIFSLERKINSPQKFCKNILYVPEINLTVKVVPKEFWQQIGDIFEIFYFWENFLILTKV